MTTQLVGKEWAKKFYAHLNNVLTGDPSKDPELFEMGVSSEIETGTDETAKMWSPKELAQAIAALGGGGGGNYPFYAALLTQTGTSAPVITDPYTNVSGLTMTPAYVGVGNFTLTQSGTFINNSVRTRVTFKQLIATIPGFVEAGYTTGFPQNKITLKTFNTSFVQADDILAGYLYVEILDNTL